MRSEGEMAGVLPEISVSADQTLEGWKIANVVWLFKKSTDEADKCRHAVTLTWLMATSLCGENPVSPMFLRR